MEWIDKEEEMPPKDEMVLVIHGDNPNSLFTGRLLTVAGLESCVMFVNNRYHAYYYGSSPIPDASFNLPDDWWTHWAHIELPEKREPEYTVRFAIPAGPYKIYRDSKALTGYEVIDLLKGD